MILTFSTGTLESWCFSPLALDFSTEEKIQKNSKSLVLTVFLFHSYIGIHKVELAMLEYHR